jgi:hypothetical protein
MQMSRIVVRTPLTELWDNDGPIAARRGRDLSAEDIRAILHSGSVKFVVANVGSPLRWVPEDECFAFWRNEVQPRVADPSGASLNEFPGGYCYFATEWMPVRGSPLVVLECAH